MDKDAKNNLEKKTISHTPGHLGVRVDEKIDKFFKTTADYFSVGVDLTRYPLKKMKDMGGLIVDLLDLDYKKPSTRYDPKQTSASSIGISGIAMGTLLYNIEDDLNVSKYFGMGIMGIGALTLLADIYLGRTVKKGMMR